MVLSPREFKTVLSLHRSNMTKARRKQTRRRKPKAMPYPIGVEKAYRRVVSSYIDRVVSKSLELLRPFLLEYTSTRTDAEDADLEAIMRRLDNEMEIIYGTTYLSTAGLGQALTSIAEQVLGVNSAFLQKEITVMAGTPIQIAYDWWVPTKNIWMQENYSLIKSLSREYITKLNSIVINGIQNGDSFETLAGNIEKLSANISGARSRLIARDQIGKLNSLVNKSQSLSLGMKVYFWITSRDERVRGNPMGRYAKAIPSHYIMDGLMMSWENNQVYSEDGGETWLPKTAKMEPQQAGMALQCRCTAASSFNDVITPIDREIGDDI